MPAKARPRRSSTTPIPTRSGTVLLAFALALALAVPLGAAFARPAHDGGRIAAAGYVAGTTPHRDVVPPGGAETDAPGPSTDPTPTPAPTSPDHPAAVRVPTSGSGPAAQLVGLAAVLLIVGGLLVQLTRKRPRPPSPES
ncbi:hypothetical protein GCM10023205_33770 [Yinghuangia aomiensis]|uniref:MYXO-CTERM domain-containing protein n=1 Tax=Yinghuangia aomiensis TaxID=676205 RepID=A0ABP9HBI3_9ACTN